MEGLLQEEGARDMDMKEPIKQLITDPITGELVQKSVFIVFYKSLSIGTIDYDKLVDQYSIKNITKCNAQRFGIK